MTVNSWSRRRAARWRSISPRAARTRGGAASRCARWWRSGRC